MNKKSKLYIVGTPIGNLKDITLRALDVLDNVDYIACEDTRVSIKLLNYFNIKNKKLISYHNFNELTSSNKIINLLESGNDIALISDAGMPSIADPGYVIIDKIKKSNFEWEIIPGVSALTTIMSVSSMDNEFTFLGFGKQKKNQLTNQLKSLMPGTYVFFVAPHKLEFLLKTINDVLFDNNKIFLGKELTKIHQSFYSGNAQEILKQINGNYKGEFSLVLKVKKKKERERVNTKK